MIKPKVLGDIVDSRTAEKRDHFLFTRADQFEPRQGLARAAHEIFENLRLFLGGFVFGIWLGCGSDLYSRAIGQSSTDERKALESQLAQLEDQINQYEGQVAAIKNRAVV